MHSFYEYFLYSSIVNSITVLIYTSICKLNYSLLVLIAPYHGVRIEKEIHLRVNVVAVLLQIYKRDLVADIARAGVNVTSSSRL